MENLLHEERRYKPPEHLQQNAHIKSFQQYHDMYQQSLDDPNHFWLEKSKNLEWISPPKIACKYVWDTKKKVVEHTWFEDGILNVSANCLDRHLTSKRKNKPALIWQGDDPIESRSLTYSQLHNEVCIFSNVLKNLHINKGDRVCLYMPTMPEAIIAMLACSRIGAIHSVVFGGFSAESLALRINDLQSKLLITVNMGIRGGKKLPLKAIADEALINCPTVKNVLVIKRTDDECNMVEGRDLWYEKQKSHVSDNCPPTPLKAEDPLFVLYTSGSTGKPKGLVHTQAGYLLYTSITHKYVFDLQEDDVYWCTADIGWITGHSYGVYGPLANGATVLFYEGTPLYPHPDRYWQIVDKYKVTILYTAPTAIRTLIAAGDSWPQKHSLQSLRILGSVGEPINPEAWIWYHDVIGKKRCPVIDTWWQTETGGIMISPLPASHVTKPGSATRPFFGIDPVILETNKGHAPCKENEGGALCIQKPWPGIARTMWDAHERYIETYFCHYKDMYYSGDGCRKDEDGDYWLLGRLDDVVNISGHRIGTAEVESALVSHPQVAEAAVVGIPHEIKGESLVAFVTLVEGSDTHLESELKNHVKKVIGPIAVPDEIRFSQKMPKTRSGKIMRRILRKMACGETDFGDISTLAE